MHRSLRLYRLLLSAALAVGGAWGLPATSHASSGIRIEPESPHRIRIEIPASEVALQKTATGGQVVALLSGSSSQQAPGAPDLPQMPLVLWVDEDFRMTGVQVVSQKDAPLGNEAIAPVAKPVTGGSDGALAPEVRASDPAVYGADRAYPWTLAQAQGDGWMRGRRLAFLTVSPVRWNPVTRELVLATELVLEIQGERDASRGLKPRPAPWDAREDAELAQQAIDLRSSSRLAPPIAPEPEAFWSPTYRPSLDGSAVEYVIVTNNAMAAAFQVLADWKTKRGVQTVVRTVEWIRQTYPNGVDQSEQLRTFLRDAYENWGTVWVLLGGDTEIVPVRYANHYLNIPPDDIPADYYYSCLDGNWNGNGDSAFGKAGNPPAGDAVDLTPELSIGRAPASTPAQAQIFVSKVIDYERGVMVNSQYPNSALLLCEELVSGGLDGAIYGEDVRQRLPAGMRVVRMYELFQNWPGSIPETRPAVLDSLRAGFGIVHHVGHGFRNTMSVGDGTLGNADIDNLTNGSRQSVVYAINCASAAIDFNAIGERFLKNGQGGGVAYIGCSRLASSGPAQGFQNEFYETVFQDSTTAIGKALALTKLAFVPDSQGETLARWYMFALVLIGDPEMPIWRRAPNDIVSASASTFTMGSSSYAVTATAGGSPLNGAKVVLAKTGEVIASGVTNASGMVNIPWRPHTTGTFTITVSKPDYRPSERTASVVTSASTYLFVDLTTINDDSTPPSNGNGDGFADAGERVELAVRVRNGGVVSATSVNGTLSILAGGPNVSIVNGAVSYGTIAAGGQSSGSGNFVLDFAPGAPDAFQPTFQIAFTSGQGASADVFALSMRGVELEHYSHILSDQQPGGDGDGIPEPGEALTYRVTLRNTGNARADQVAATLRVLNRNTMLPDPQVTVTDPNASFGTIGPLSSVQGDPVGFTLSGSAVVANLLVELTLSNSEGPQGVQLSDLLPPDPVTGLVSVGTMNSIRLNWTRPAASDVRGYDIYRSPTGQGNWARINSFTGVGSATYEDANLASLTRYYYYVVARDSSFNESTPSAQIAATTTPPLASGWPIETGQESSAGVIIDDLDRDGDFELVTGADAIYAWHHDGNEIRDGDQNPITSGVFTTDGQDPNHGFQATPATADLTGDGDVEIVGLAWHEAKVYVWNLDGSLEPGWPQDIDGDFNWSSPVIADLDLDGKMEIIAASGMGGKIYAWHDDGLEVVDGDQNPFTFGIFYVTGTSFLYSSPAVGNIDADPYPEIVFGTQSAFGKIFALKRTGALVPGWPVNTMGQVTASPAMADLDNDDQNEVIIASESDSVFVFRGDGTNYPGWPRQAVVNTGTARTSSPVVGDLNEDGFLDIIFAANNGQMHVWNRNGTPMPGWGSVFFGQDVLNEDATQSTPTVADVDGDHRLEVLLGAENRLIYGWNHDGTVLAGFPITVGAEQRGSISIWDLDADGKVEIAAICNDRSVYVWDMAGDLFGDRIPWPYFRHDARNTGCYGTRITVVGIADPGPEAAPIAFTPVLYPAQPNPFNPATHIRFLVPGETGATRPVKLRIFDVAGRVVRDLIDGPYSTGEGNVVWDGRMSRGGRAPSGSYFMRLEVGGKVLTGKLTLLQ